LGSDRRFGAFAADAVGSRWGVRQVGTHPSAATVSSSQRALALALQSLHTRDCHDYFRLWFTGKLTKAQACAQAFTSTKPSYIRRLRLQVAADPDARPLRVG